MYSYDETVLMPSHAQSRRELFKSFSISHPHPQSRASSEVSNTRRSAVERSEAQRIERRQASQKCSHLLDSHKTSTSNVQQWLIDSEAGLYPGPGKARLVGRLYQRTAVH